MDISAELQLHRFDVLQSGATAKGSLRVLPPGQNRQQKVALGDSAGVLQCISVKKGETNVVFKTLPTGRKVSCVTLGKGQTNQRDKIFVAQGQTVQGFTKKGKQFYNFDTNLAEGISTLHVRDNSIWLTGDYTFTQLVDHVEAQFYIAPDHITDSDLVTLAPLSPGYTEPCVVLGCQDYTIRVVDRSVPIHQISVEGAVTAVKHIADSHDATGLNTGRAEVLYGTHNGILGQLFLDHMTVKNGWKMKSTLHKGAIKAIYSEIDFSKDGINDIAVGRDTGSLEIYGFDQQQQPVLLFSTSLEESINSIDGGYFTSPNVQDLLVQTYSGKVVAFSEEEVGTYQPTAPTSTSPLKKFSSQLSKVRQSSMSTFGVEDRQGSIRAADRVQAAQAEVTDLQQRVDKERQAFAQMSANLIASSSHIDLQGSFVLDADDACHVLTVETGGPISSVALQSNVLLDLQECAVAILSLSPPDPSNRSMTLATYRCQESTNRVAMRMRIVEGQYGTVQVFVVPQATPCICKAAVHAIKPLCMHHRINSWDDSTAMNELLITGNFDMLDGHAWLAASLPDVPPRAPTPDGGAFCFQGAVHESLLVCQFKSGELQLKSNNLSTLAILREFITKEATMQKIRIQLSFKLDPATVVQSIDSLWPRMKVQLQQTREDLLFQALQEIKMQEGDCSFLAAELKSLLDKDIKAKEKQPDAPKLEYMAGLVKDLFLDWQRFSGSVTSSKARLGQLTDLLQSTGTDSKQIVEFIVNVQ